MKTNAHKSVHLVQWTLALWTPDVTKFVTPRRTKHPRNGVRDDDVHDDDDDLILIQQINTQKTTTFPKFFLQN